MTSKTDHRISIVRKIMEIISSDTIHGVLNYQNVSEFAIKEFMYQPLLETIDGILMQKGVVHHKEKAK